MLQIFLFLSSLKLQFNQRKLAQSIFVFLGRLSNSGDLLPWVGILRSRLILSSQDLLDQFLTYLVCSF